MAAMGGYANTYTTPYGDAGFWVVTDLHMVIDVPTNIATMSVTLSGYPTQEAADAGMLSMGKYTFMMTQQQFVAAFTVAQPTVQAAILASDPAWAGATYVPPA
jgi:hypothetical protein